LLNSNFVSLIKLKDKRRLLHSKKLYKLCLAGKIKESFNKKTNKREGKRVKRLYINLSKYYLVFIRGFRYFLVVSCDASRII
jgi:putative NADPH-quinone reductase